MKVIVPLLLLAVIGTASSARILCLMPVPGPSHNIIASALCKELAKLNHTVVAYSSEALKKPIPNYNEVVLTNLGKVLEERKNNLFGLKNIPRWFYMFYMPSMGLDVSEAFLSQPEVKELIASDEKFDLIYMEIFVDESIIAGMSKKFNAPVVALSSSMPLMGANYVVGNPAPSSYIPDILLGLPTKMTFCERLYNFAVNLGQELIHRIYYLPRQDAIMRKHFGNHLPPVDEIVKNVSVVLVNHHHSLAYGRPYVPNMIEIGGFHVRPPQPLPKDLQKFLDEAKDGVIYFSFGSNIQGSMMPPEKRDAFLKVFSQLKQKVLWKWETDLPGKPDNVKIAKWLPQSDILAHPNVKLFITHGGLLSTIESVMRGVPLVGIPIFAEQPLNVRQAEMAGFARGLDFDEITVENFKEAITDVLENPKYTENVKQRSALLNDTPMSALDTAIYWVEYVLRHKGAPHMRSAAQDLSWFSLYLLDVYAVLLSITLAVSGITFLVVRTCIRMICKRTCSKKGDRKKKDEKKKNN